MFITHDMTAYTLFYDHQTTTFGELIARGRELRGMGSHALRLHALGALILASSACSQSHDVQRSDSQPRAAGERALVAEMPAQRASLCERLAELLCAAEQRCCERPGRSLDACRSARNSECAQSAHLDEVADNPVSGFDRAAAEGVFAGLEQKLQACDPDVVRWSASEAGLRRLFRGSVARGDSCKPAQVLNASESEQAAALLSCRDAADTACMPASLLGEWTCSSKSARGGGCLTDDNCAADAYCATPADAVFGTCQPRLPRGALCDSATQCESFSCDGEQCRAPDVQVAFCPSL